MKKLHDISITVSDAADGADPDPQRAVLPAIIWQNVKQGTGPIYHCYRLSVGWWRWGLNLTVIISGQP